MGTGTDKSALTRSHSQKKPQHSVPVQSQVRSRPFAPPQTEAPPQAEVPDLQTQLENATRLGHSFAKLATPSIAKLPLPSTVQRHQEDDELQRQPDVSTLQRHEEHNEDNIIHRQADNSGSFEASNTLESQIKENQSSGQPLDAEVRSFMEPRFQHSFANVRVHTNRQAVQMNQELRAQAFTNGNHIYFNSGKYTPSSNSGKELLAHELTHTIQQTGGNDLQRQENTSACSAGCACASCVPVIQRKPDGAHRAACPCSNCAGGTKLIQAKLTVGAPGDSYEQEADQVAQQVMRMSLPNQSKAIQRHEDEDEVQKKPILNIAAIQRQTSDRPIALEASAAQATVIQRHASWEHKMLGDIDVNDLQIIAAGRDTMKAKKTGVKVESGANEPVTVKAQNKTVKVDDVLHVLGQEINRLRIFREHPPQEATLDAEKALAKLDYESRVKVRSQAIGEEIDDKYGIVIRSATKQRRETERQQLLATAKQEEKDSPQWQVRLVTIPHTETGIGTVVTYGEMNTLADFVGNPEQLMQIHPDKLKPLIQGIRQESLIKFLRLYDEISGKNAVKKFFTQDKLGEGFEGASGNTGRGDLTGELRLMFGGKTTVKDDQNTVKDESGYEAGLARNACHFAPFSWDSWANYHQAAALLAKQSWDANEEADDLESQALLNNNIDDYAMTEEEEEAQEKREEAAELRNQALLKNGFGDHYLQDSYAAGHLINKDEIMKWYVQWVAKTTTAVDYMKDSSLRKMVKIAENQPGIGLDSDRYDKSKVGTRRGKDIQSVENIQGATTKDRFEALGLKIPNSVKPGTDEHKFTVGWQQQTLITQKTKEITVKQGMVIALTAGIAHDGQSVQGYLDRMVQEGVALETGKKGLKVWTDRDKLYTLRHAYIPTDQVKFMDMTDANNPTADQDYEKAATQVTYKDYMEFMNSSVLQASTNILHDHYCAKGLKVTTVAGGELPFKIYGDNAMLKGDSDKGVRHSAITANMSRDSIYNIVKTGQPLHPLKSIFDRFPDRVELPNGSLVGLDTWHTGTLKAQCENGFSSIFREANRSIKTFGGGMTGGNLSKKVSAEVHPGAAF